MEARGTDHPADKSHFSLQSVEMLRPWGNEIRPIFNLLSDSATRTSSDCQGIVHYLCRAAAL